MIKLDKQMQAIGIWLSVSATPVRQTCRQKCKWHTHDLNEVSKSIFTRRVGNKERGKERKANLQGDAAGAGGGALWVVETVQCL